MSSAGKPLGRQNHLARVVDELCKSEHGMLSWLARGGRVLPSRDLVVEAAEALRSALFPGYFGASDLTEANMRFHVGATLDRMLLVLKEQIKRGLCFECDHHGPECPGCADKAETITAEFFEQLPRLQHILATDVQAAPPIFCILFSFASHTKSDIKTTKRLFSADGT